jgi:hypothetical protein
VDVNPLHRTIAAGVVAFSLTCHSDPELAEGEEPPHFAFAFVFAFALSLS